MSVCSKYIKHAFCSISTLVPNKIIHFFSPKIILPSYHAVADYIPNHLYHLYKPRTQKEFIKDLDFMLKYYKPIDLAELINKMHTREDIKQNMFHISFDDGLRECHDIIAPILKEKGIPATFFLNPDFIGNKDLMFRYKASLLIKKIRSNGNKKHYNLINPIKNCTYLNKEKLDKWARIINMDFQEYLKQYKPYMNEGQIKQLIMSGFTVGAHSLDHPEYSHISYEEQIKQTKESITYINNVFDLRYKVFAFPFNDDFISKNFFGTIFNPLKVEADLIFGVAGIKKDFHLLHLQRIPMEKSFAGNTVIKGDYLYYLAKKIFNKNKISRK